MLQQLLKMAKEVSRLSEDELNKEIQKTKITMEAEQLAYGKANFETTLKAHMLMIPLVFDLKDENKVLNSKEIDKDTD
jgi:hypothetical protein